MAQINCKPYCVKFKVVISHAKSGRSTVFKLSVRLSFRPSIYTSIRNSHGFRSNLCFNGPILLKVK